MKNKKEVFLTSKLSAKMTGNYGITLIALIITIIVMLILAIVSIKIASDSGLFDKAQKGIDLTSQAATTETLKDIVLKHYNYKTGKIDIAEIANEIEIEIDESSLTDGVYKIEYKGYNFEITPEGKVTCKGKINLTETSEPETPTLPEGWDETKVTLYEDENEVKVPIPNGYVVSNIDGEKTVQGGLVIYQGNISITSNQFIWIPITNIENMAVLQTDSTINYRGVLYDWVSDSTGNTQYSWSKDLSGYREPANLRISYDNTTNITGWTDTLYQNEFNEMVASVKKYGGFYVGRYETGGYNTNQAVIRAGEVSNSINNATWYTMYNKTKTLSTNSATAHIIWGSQYDQMLKFAQCANEKTPIKDESTIESGAVATDCYKNIYDLCGNVLDWTMEALNYDYRVRRGAFYLRNYFAMNRYNEAPSSNNTYYGSRTTLYVAL